MFGNAIVGVDAIDGYPRGRDALALAKQLASRDGRLTLACVVRDVPGEHRTALRRLESLRDEGQVDARLLSVDARSVADGLHELAARHGGDLLVIGASRGDEYDRLVVGYEARAVIERAPCAVAVAPVGHVSRPPRLTTIGAGYDGSPQSERAVALARRLAAERGAELSAFEAVQEPVFVRDPCNPESEVDAYVAQTRGRIAEVFGVEAHAAVGDTFEELTRYGASIDLLVLGSHTYGPLDRLRSPTIAQRLAGSPPCPLLVLSSDG